MLGHFLPTVQNGDDFETGADASNELQLLGGPARDPARCKGFFLNEIFTTPSREFHASCSVCLLD
jgi:hypothetical protein